MALITQPGIYDLPESVYHSDPVIAPSLSNSIARTFLDKSPKHAKFEHARLNPNREPKEITTAMDKGSAIHKLILGKGAPIQEIKAKDYKSPAARSERDACREAGIIPLLSKDFDVAHACSTAVLTEMHEREDCAEFFAPGKSEQVMIWRQHDVWCRAMVDRMPDDPYAPLFDLKGTMMSANPVDWDRRMVRAYRTQDRFYAAGSRRLRMRTPAPMRFVVFEMVEPFAMSVLIPGKTLQHVADEDVQRAVALWSECTRSGKWPGYPHTATIEAPNWLLREVEEREMREEALEDAI
ncbi:PD-(D/E)XK nuclease-like domain-containing protein [Acetobacter sacchari]|uniref:PD-(D/E)XK nuclease-like domain-containing protein n=1 Tax=Acetobacter sacchari TaxID=2661687 RepID=A0ABS3M1R4_9PROT|nr:PD-(D/E)XK nuclease-like domain-containing protein [Acetobacter sacchari]MBO1362065.1 PD-(D/E)XK nuclease-like domain-containing protein [Acetobacter sacchari]